MNSFFRMRQESRWRWLMVPAVLVAAGAHLPVIRPHLDEAPYMGVLFVVLSAACVVLASAAISWDTPVVYALSVLTCGLAVLGYAATRLVAFPMLADDVGNWFEPLGMLSVGSETVVVITALAVLIRSGALAGRSARLGLSPAAAPLRAGR
jgi:hypothetical protein